MIDPMAFTLPVALYVIWQLIHCIAAFGDYNARREDAYLRGVELVNIETAKHSVAMREAAQASDHG